MKVDFRLPATARAAALILGLLTTPLVLDNFGNLGFVSSIAAQPATLTESPSTALNTYNHALNQFVSILRIRRAQIDAKQQLPNLPGQALYLARISMMSTYKDLTDALPSKIGRPNKFGIPPAYFDADNEPLIDEYMNLFNIMQAPPPMRKNQILRLVTLLT
jgi:hypothetical protein